ncbi:MAG: ABC transporter permease [Thermoprotei archaeon]
MSTASLDLATIIVGYVRSVLIYIAPYILTSLGVVISGRSGIYNISAEGVMLLGASVTFLATYFSGGNILIGISYAVLVGVVVGLAFGFLTISLKLNQFVVGTTFFILCSGFANLLYKLFIGVTLTPPSIETLRPITVPVLSDVPYVGDALFKHNLLVYLSFVLVAASYYLLYKTFTGLNFRSVGENPKAADTLGINVTLYRYVGTTIGTILMSVSGSYLVLSTTGLYTETIVLGRGWISVGIAIFGRWHPLWALVGSALFASVEALVYLLQSLQSVLGLKVPPESLLTLPFIATLIVLALVYKKAELPQAIGRPYDREAPEEYA